MIQTEIEKTEVAKTETKTEVAKTEVAKTETEKNCYTRSIGKAWMLAEAHHRHGLEMYLDLQRDKRMRQADPILICTQRADGSIFMAHFRKKNTAIYAFQEDDRELEIMFCSITIPMGSK